MIAHQMFHRLLRRDNEPGGVDGPRKYLDLEVKTIPDPPRGRLGRKVVEDLHMKGKEGTWTSSRQEFPPRPGLTMKALEGCNQRHQHRGR